MIQISKSEDYAVLLVSTIAKHFDIGLVPLSAIAKQHNLSVLFLRNIAQDLKKAGIITAVEGKTGGYRLVHDPKQILLGKILESVSKKPLFSCCQNTPDGKCHASKCSHGLSLRRMHNQFLEKLYDMPLSEALKQSTL